MGQLNRPVVKDTNINYTNLVNTNTTSSINRGKVGVVGLGRTTETLKCVLFLMPDPCSVKRKRWNVVCELRPDLIFFTETWANDEKLDNELALDGYYTMLNDRKGRRGGGCLIHSKKEQK